MPDRLEPISRVTRQSHLFGGMRVGLRPVEEDELPGVQSHPAWSWGALTVDVAAPSSQVAVDRAMEPLELAMESLSFQFQTAVQIGQLEALDVTTPVAEGDEREMWLFPFGSGYPLRRYRPASVQMAGVLTESVPDLALPLADLNDRERAALDWYLKSLAAPFQMDQFIFLWIAAETLWALSDIKVEAPYKAPCDHEIPNCPECNEPTEKLLLGLSMERFFVELGVEDATAHRLWRARQVLHGAERFDSALIQRLDELIQILRAVVNGALKPVLGLPAESPPSVDPGQFSIAPNPALGGMRRIEARDLAALN